MRTCVSFMKAVISIKELNIALEHVTDLKWYITYLLLLSSPAKSGNNPIRDVSAP